MGICFCFNLKKTAVLITLQSLRQQLKSSTHGILKVNSLQWPWNRAKWEGMGTVRCSYSVTGPVQQCDTIILFQYLPSLVLRTVGLSPHAIPLLWNNLLLFSISLH